MNNETECFALVTGASKGLGKAFCIELAKMKINVLLVALPNEDLESFSNYLKEYGIKSFYKEVDLLIKEDIIEMVKWVNNNFNISFLINNVGRGGTISFEKSNINDIDGIIQLNIRAMALITHQLLPNLKKQKQSYILNVSSMASFSPIGYKTVYPASKSFIQSFSLGLYQELKNTNVFVSVVHPGPMKTNPDVTKRTEKQGILGKAGELTPERVAKRSLLRLLKKDSGIIIGWFNKVQWVLIKITPLAIRLPFITRIAKREIDSDLDH
ncbi:MAG: SDR family NAD(P)-dependent oxidoreductase [Bacteroidota bacterium]|nr:SDR family NAD(P)-dependent oxidoreductase [Bacteroidota bacterium]